MSNQSCQCQCQPPEPRTFQVPATGNNGTADTPTCGLWTVTRNNNTR
jgi:hypothetical protein